MGVLRNEDHRSSFQYFVFGRDVALLRPYGAGL